MGWSITGDWSSLSVGDIPTLLRDLTSAINERRAILNDYPSPPLVSSYTWTIADGTTVSSPSVSDYYGLAIRGPRMRTIIDEIKTRISSISGGNINGAAWQKTGSDLSEPSADSADHYTSTSLIAEVNAAIGAFDGHPMRAQTWQWLRDALERMVYLMGWTFTVEVDSADDRSASVSTLLDTEGDFEDLYDDAVADSGTASSGEPSIIIQLMKGRYGGTFAARSDVLLRTWCEFYLSAPIHGTLIGGIECTRAYVDIDDAATIEYDTHLSSFTLTETKYEEAFSLSWPPSSPTLHRYEFTNADYADIPFSFDPEVTGPTFENWTMTPGYIAVAFRNFGYTESRYLMNISTELTYG